MVLTPEFAKVVRLAEDIKKKCDEIIDHAKHEGYKEVMNVTADMELAVAELTEFVLDDDARKLRESVEGPDDTPEQKRWEPDPDDLLPPGGSKQ